MMGTAGWTTRRTLAALDPWIRKKEILRLLPPVPTVWMMTGMA
jgi:hypothetical protein